MQKIVIGTLLIAALQGLSACAVETSTDEEALDEAAGEPASDATYADPSGDDVAGSEDQPDEPADDETASGEDEIVEKGRCGAFLNPTVSGGAASWTLTCLGGVIYIDGWVEDTKADGLCARVKVVLPNGRVVYSPKACPKGEVQYFYFNGRGSVINAYLQTI